MFKKTILIVGIIIISGLSGIIADRYTFPYLANSRFFSKNKFFKKAVENVTVINKTEQVYVKEDSSINKITNQIVPAIVNVVSYQENTNKKNNLILSTNNTGEILTSDGIIMTSAGAIIPNGIYKVILNDGNVHEAKILGIDKWSNLAFLKIIASNLPVIPFGNSDEYDPGEKLVAISNNNSQYQNKFTAGLLSSFDASYNISGEALSKAENIEGVFLTDFNEKILSVGSPVIDYSGKMMGVTGEAMKNGRLEYFQIPSNKIKLILEKVINNSLDSNITLGIYYLPINKSLALANNLSTDQGALIYSASGQQGLAIISGSVADKAGLKINDIITKVENVEISTKNNLSDILYQYKKGDRIEFTVLRAQQELKIMAQF
ncbi:MAG: S1C family serine protease [Parcubacteria group bacterium]|jgi:S1-C subfamily serine protease